MKKILSIILAILLAGSVLAPAAFGVSEEADPTGFGIKNMSYIEAKITIPFMNFAFDMLNLFAGSVGVWTPLDGCVYKNQRYGERDCQTYDLYIPQALDVSESHGMILFIHGGTWTMGDKRHMAWACARYAKKGYITATMNYDLASQGNSDVARATGSKENATVFDMLDDVTSAVGAIQAKCGSLGYSLGSLALSGVSAGSHIAALYAYTRADESPVPVKLLIVLTTPVGFFKGTFNNYTDDEVAQFASIVSGHKLSAGDITDPRGEAAEILKSISPCSNIGENSVPTLLGFADRDTTIGTNQYETIRPALEQYEVPYDVVWWKNCDHTLIRDSAAVRQWLNMTNTWLEIYM